MLNTWKKIESPPIPSKNDVKIRLIEIALILILDIKTIPFVISNSPVNIGAINSGEMFIKLKKGVYVFTINSNRWLDFSIEMITEKSTMKPPIRRIVDILFVILVLNISPRLDIWIFFSWVLLKIELSVKFEVFFFQNLNIIPTVIAASICVISNR